MRLYVTYMLHRIWKQESLVYVAEHFRVTRGWLQNVLQLTISQAASLARFAEVMFKIIFRFITITWNTVHSIMLLKIAVNSTILVAVYFGPLTTCLCSIIIAHELATFYFLFCATTFVLFLKSVFD